MNLDLLYNLTNGYTQGIVEDLKPCINYSRFTEFFNLSGAERFQKIDNCIMIYNSENTCICSASVNSAFDLMFIESAGNGAGKQFTTDYMKIYKAALNMRRTDTEYINSLSEADRAVFLQEIESL